MDRISQYLESQLFVNWVFHPTPELEKKWREYEAANPAQKQNILLAKKVLEKFRTVDKQLTEQEKIALFARILSEIENKQKTRTIALRLLNFTKYAALAVIFFAIGALVFYQHQYANPELVLHASSNQLPGPNTTLTRPNGQNISVADNKSIFSYQSKDNKLTINDSIKLEKQSGNFRSEMNRLTVPFGKTSEVLLADGTRVFLNAGSQLVYPENFDGKRREVYLLGEGFFEVHKDQQHPFVVVTSDINIEVKGTKFNLSAYESDGVYETVLTEGKVRIRQNKAGLFEDPVDLEPNQMASYNRSTKQTNVIPVNVDYYTLWKEGMFRFESNNLSWLLKKVERFYNVHFDIVDPAMGQLKISGKLDLSESKEAIIGVLSTTTSLKFVEKSENYYEVRK